MKLLANIILMGIKHCGKTTLGKRLAEVTASQFADLDEVILKRYGSPEATIRSVYRSSGREGFQRLETGAAREVAAYEHGACWIVSLGGGTIENGDAIAAFSDRARFVYLHEGENVLFRRIARKGIPPFLSQTDPEGSFHDLYERRHELYVRRADLIIEKHDTSVDIAFELLCNGLEEAGYAG